MLISADMTEKWIAGLLRFAGAIMVLAFLAVVMPTDWMANSHERLGLGEFPDSTLVQYLARSISALYGIHGALYLFLATDVRRYVPVIRFLAYTNLVFGPIMVGVDMHANLPTFWILAEGPPLAGFGLLMLWLARSIPADP